MPSPVGHVDTRLKDRNAALVCFRNVGSIIAGKSCLSSKDSIVLTGIVYVHPRPGCVGLESA